MSSTENTKTVEAGAGENNAEPAGKQDQQGAKSSEPQVSVVGIPPPIDIADEVATARVSGLADRDQ